MKRSMGFIIGWKLSNLLHPSLNVLVLLEALRSIKSKRGGLKLSQLTVCMDIAQCGLIAENKLIGLESLIQDLKPLLSALPTLRLGLLDLLFSLAHELAEEDHSHDVSRKIASRRVV